VYVPYLTPIYILHYILGEGKMRRKTGEEEEEEA